MTTRSIRDLLAEHDFFAPISSEHLDVLAGCGRNEVFPAGTLIMREGDAADHFFVLREGRVAISTHVPQREPLVVATLGPGDVLGRAWLVPPHRWRFDAIAVQETHAIRLERACLQEKCDADPALGYAVMQRFAQTTATLLDAARLQLIDVYGDAHGT